MTDAQFCALLSLIAFCALALGAEGSVKRVMRAVLFGMWICLLFAAWWLNAGKGWRWPL